MEGLEAATSSAAAPAPAPAAAAPAAPAPAPAAAPQAPASSGGGSMNFKEILSSINWIEVGFGALGVAALFKTMEYYSYMMKVQKSAKTELENKIDDLAIKVADLQSATQRDEIFGSQGFDGMFY